MNEQDRLRDRRLYASSLLMVVGVVILSIMGAACCFEGGKTHAGWHFTPLAVTLLPGLVGMMWYVA